MYIKMTSNCYQKHKERLRKEAREKYQNLSEKAKDKGRKKVQERHQNLYYQPVIKRYQYHYPVDVVILP